MNTPAWRSAFSNYAKSASLPSENGNPDLLQKRLLRYILQSAARELLPDERVAKCLRVRVPCRIIPEGVSWHVTAGGAGQVQVLYSAKRKRAFYGNLAQCASVWHDPVCASKITERRRVEMSESLAGAKFYQAMVTRTFQHARDDKLVDLRKDFAEAKRRVKSGRGWITFENHFKVVGSISGTEVTYGQDNGFHLHDHSLYLFESSVNLDEFREGMFKRYAAAMEGRGRYVSGLYGLDVRATNDSVGDYVSKWGVESELAKYPVKKGREGHYSAFQLLELYAGGESWAGGVFQEYAQAMKGSRQLVWSPGLRKLLSLGKEVSDSELVEAQEDDTRVLTYVTLEQWRRVLAREKKGELLEVASYGRLDVLKGYLRTMGVYLADD